MAAQAEAIQTAVEEEVAGYEYAHSKHDLERWGGALALKGSVSFEKENAYKKLAYDDFISALREMLNTDHEYSQRLDIDDTDHEFPVINRQVCAEDGTPMVDIGRRGAVKSALLAHKNPAYRGFADRDKGDEAVAKRNDALLPGQTHTVVTWAPEDDLRGPYKKLYNSKGYRSGLIWIHSFSMTDEGVMKASFFSVQVKDESKFQGILAKHGIDLEGIPYNERAQHGVVTETTPEEAEQQIREIRDEYYEAAGMSKNRKSVTSFIKQSEETIRGFFDAYYPELSKAAYTGKNNSTMKDFAQSVLSMNIGKLKPEVRQALLRVANSDKFDDKAIKVMDSLIRYAVVEELRKGLSASNSTGYASSSYVSKVVWHDQLNSSSSIPAHVMHSNYLLAGNVASGVRANRSYGGCPGVDIGEDGNPYSFGANSNSTGGADSLSFTVGGMFGGRGRRNYEHDEFGSLKFNCPKGHENKRPRGKLIDKCKTCGTSVKC